MIHERGCKVKEQARSATVRIKNKSVCSHTIVKALPTVAWQTVFVDWLLLSYVMSDVRKKQKQNGSLE